MVFLLLLLAIPAAEIFLFIEVGGHIGAWLTVGLIFATAIVGGMILRFQGLKTLANARREIEAQRVPVKELAEGAALALSAMLLLTPGFATDALGIVLLFPPVRHALIAFVVARFMARHGSMAGFGARAKNTDNTIDGEFEVIDDSDDSTGADKSSGDARGNKPQIGPDER